VPYFYFLGAQVVSGELEQIVFEMEVARV